MNNIETLKNIYESYRIRFIESDLSNELIANDFIIACHTFLSELNYQVKNVPMNLYQYDVVTSLIQKTINLIGMAEFGY